MKLMTTLGTRPDLIRMSEMIRIFDEDPEIDHVLAHSGQHYSHNMDGIFFEQLGMRKPDMNFGLGSGSHGEQGSQMLIKMEQAIEEQNPDICLFLGDTNTVLGAISAAKSDIPVVHIEAGMRSFDWRMPEEKNRVIVDKMADINYVYTHRYRENLLYEGFPGDRVIVVGNPIVDIVEKYSPLADNYRNEITKLGLTEGNFILVTIHRRENVDNPEILRGILDGIQQVGNNLDMPVYYPMSYRTAQSLKDYGIELPDNFITTEPIGFLEFLAFEKYAHIIISDSGTVQEESSILSVPTLVTRISTERPETIESGGCLLVGTESQDIVNGAREILDRPRDWQHLLGDGKTSKRIHEHMMSFKDKIMGGFEPPIIDHRKRYAFSENTKVGDVHGGGWTPPPMRLG
jgi:UDP-N-acetylglucosamine 2-epimerase (non-hydrolysing)